MMNLRDTYNKIAESWQSDHAIDDWWQEGTDQFAKLLTRGASVLDVGCGTGLPAQRLCEHGLTVLGIDFSEKQIELAKINAPDATFKVMDFNDVAILQQTFDGIFIQASLLHVPRNKAGDFLSAVVKKLAPGGYLYVAVKGAQPGKPLEEEKAETKYGSSFVRFFSYFTLDEITALLTDLGFEIVLAQKKISNTTEWVQVIGKNQS